MGFPFVSVSGSPPRAWGRCRRPRVAAARSGFTPTCVGTVAWRSAAASTASVHPHVRGDGCPTGRSARRFRGSPPRAWGRCRFHQRIRTPDRFTPTCVGTVFEKPSKPGAGTVHPHVRGDGLIKGAHDVLEIGSPPRAWGRLLRHRHHWACPRFTPTCVGTVLRPCQAHGTTPVHPHVRGDGIVQCSPINRAFGSPPRAWGRYPHRQCQ